MICFAHLIGVRYVTETQMPGPGLRKGRSSKACPGDGGTSTAALQEARRLRRGFVLGLGRLGGVSVEPLGGLDCCAKRRAEDDEPRGNIRGGAGAGEFLTDATAFSVMAETAETAETILPRRLSRSEFSPLS